MTNQITGMWVASLTPLDNAGNPDIGRLARHALSLLEAGCDGIVLFGTTGEGPSFSATERLSAVEALLAHEVPPARLALGIGFAAVPTAAALARAALGLGLTQLLALPPYFFRSVTADGVTSAFADLIDRVGDERLRLTLYHIPQISGVPVAPKTVFTLKERFGPLIAGIKDSSGDFSHFRAFRAAAPGVPILVGHEADIARALAEGGAGTICGMANVVPHLVRAMFGPAPPLAAMAAAIALLKDDFLPRLKAVRAAQLADPGWVSLRPPLSSADPAVGTEIARRLAMLPEASA